MREIPPHALFCMVSIFCVLIIGSLVCFGLKRKVTTDSYEELKKRTQSWWWMIIILFAAINMGTTITICFFGLLSFLALKEFLSVVPVRLEDRNAIFWAYLAIPLQYFWIGQGWYGMFIIFIPVYVFLLIPARMILSGRTQGFIKSAGIIHWALMLTVFCMSHLAFLLKLPAGNSMAGSSGLILYLLITTQGNDIAQYFWGKLIGKHKIAPGVSPGKTWEGFAGGMITITIISAFIGPYLTIMDIPKSLFCGALLCVAGFLGDLVLSAVKRDLAIKDTGMMIPGHGGLLDRVDSLLYTSPVFFHYIYYQYY